MAKGETKAKDKIVETAPEKRERETLTKAQRVAVYEAAGGRCFIFGTELPGHRTWHVEDGVLLSPEAKKLKGGRSIEELRTHMADQLVQSAAAVTATRDRYDLAQANDKLLRTTLGTLLQADGTIRFAGETKVAAGETVEAAAAR